MHRMRGCTDRIQHGGKYLVAIEQHVDGIAIQQRRIEIGGERPRGFLRVEAPIHRQTVRSNLGLVRHQPVVDQDAQCQNTDRSEYAQNDHHGGALRKCRGAIADAQAKLKPWLARAACRARETGCQTIRRQ